MGRPQITVTKRQREQKKRERQQAKTEKRALRKSGEGKEGSGDDIETMEPLEGPLPHTD